MVFTSELLTLIESLLYCYHRVLWSILYKW